MKRVGVSAVILIVLVSHGGVHEGDAPGDEVQVIAIAHGSQRYHTTIPAPMSWDDIGWYSRTLGLSEEQTYYLHLMYEEYGVAWNGLVDQNLAELDALNSAASEGGISDHEVDWKDAELIEKWIAREVEVCEKARRLEVAVFAGIERVLSTEQQSWMWRVKAHRERARSTKDFLWPNARIDLALLMEQVLVVDEGERARIDNILVEYEDRVTPAFQRLNEVMLHERIKTTWMQATARFGANGTRVAASEPSIANLVQKQLEELQDNELRIEGDMMRMIARANMAFAEALCNVVQAEQSDVLREAYYQRGWPRIHIDNENPRYVHRNLVASDRLMEDQRLKIETAWNETEQQYSAVSKEMMKLTDRFYEGVVRKGVVSGYEEYREQMTALRGERWKVGLEYSRRVTQFLNGDQRELRDMMEHYRGRVEQARKGVGSDGWPGL